MVALVTGHRGFLGRHLVERLRADSVDVAGAGRPDIEIPSAAFDALLAATRPDIVVHCAGPASVPESLEHPDEDRAGAVDVLGALLERIGGTKLVLVSSAAVYGEPAELPIAEAAPVAPLSPYGRHRVEAERLALDSGVPLAVARVFSAYGEGLRRQVLWDIAQQALAGGPVELSGTGNETRDFVHARDVAAAIAAIATRSSFEGEIVNVAAGVETSIARLAEILTAELGTEDVTFNGVGRPGDPTRWRADISHLRELGFEPATSIETGAAAYARWARNSR